MATNFAFPISIKFLHEAKDPEDDNVDVVVMLQDGSERTVTFFTLKNIQTLLGKYKETRECLSGKYFWAKDMVIAEDLREETIRAIIYEMVANKEFETAFGAVE